MAILLYWPAFKNFFQRSEVSKLMCTFFCALNPNISSMFFEKEVSCPLTVVLEIK